MRFDTLSIADARALALASQGFDTRRLHRSMVGKHVRGWWKYACANGDVSKIVLRPNAGVSSVQ